MCVFTYTRGVGVDEESASVAIPCKQIPNKINPNLKRIHVEMFTKAASLTESVIQLMVHPFKRWIPLSRG